jgi:hypothetical protein
VWSSQLLFVMVRARIERKRKAPATKLDAEVAASLGLLDVVDGLAEGESLVDVLIVALEEIGKNSIVNKLKLLKGVLTNAQKTVRSDAVKTSRMPNLVTYLNSLGTGFFLLNGPLRSVKPANHRA